MPSKEMHMPLRVERVEELLYEALETEIGGIEVYQAAISCALNVDLKREWTRYLEETRRHKKVLIGLLKAFDLDPDRDTPGRQIVRHLGKSLVSAIEMARNSDGAPKAAEIVAAECVVLAETKDHANWELVGKLAKAIDDERGTQLSETRQEIEPEEDHHLYHTKGWTRELWLDSLGLPAILPPPEEVQNVSTAVGAAKAAASREQML
jgi:hypothetical protein